MVQLAGQNIEDKVIQDLYKITVENIVQVYEATISAFKAGITAGSANVPLALLSYSGFADLLHGGAYKAPLSALPYYHPDVQAQIWIERAWDLTDLLKLVLKIPLTVRLPSGTVVTLPVGAKPEQIEAVLDSDQPHIFPKFMSDQMYFLTKEWVSLFNTNSLVTGISTNIRTLVQASEGAIKSAESGQQLARAGLSTAVGAATG